MNNAPVLNEQETISLFYLSYFGGGSVDLLWCQSMQGRGGMGERVVAWTVRR